MFSSTPQDENTGPWTYRPYPWSHIHPENTTSVSSPPRTKPSNSPMKLTARTINGSQTARGKNDATIPVKGLNGPRVKQEIGYGPFHEIKADQKRFDFSRPRTATNRPTSDINPPTVGIETEDPAQTIRLYHGSYEQNAKYGLHTKNLQSENNDPFSAHVNVSYERFDREGGNIVEATIQPQQSAAYFQKQTEMRIASKKAQLELYQKQVNERLKQRATKLKQAEQKRRSTLPSKVQAMVYSITPTSVGHDLVSPAASSNQQQQQPQPQVSFLNPESIPAVRSQSLNEFLAQSSPARAPPQAQGPYGSPSKHVQERESDGPSRSPVRPATAGGASIAQQSKKALSNMSRAESVAYLTKVRKSESRKSRERVRTAREHGLIPPPMELNGIHNLSITPLARQKIAFGLGLYPRHARTRTPSPYSIQQSSETPRGDERDLIPYSQRNPNAFAVRQQTTQDEPPSPPEKVLQIPVPNIKNKKTVKMSDAVAGRKLNKKSSLASAAAAGDGKSGSEKHSAYRRLVLERLHQVSLQLHHPLPPLCACGFTPKEEYELLFSYVGAVPGSSAANVAPPPQQSQPPFNLSTVIAQPSAYDPSIHHHHSHGTSLAQKEMEKLPTHVSVDHTRHGFQHKHNCQFYQQPEAYVKAMANLLHTLEDQQQI